MNEVLKNFGIILIIIGVIILGYYAANNITSNTPLVVSFILMTGGMVLHIILNRILD